MGQKLLTLGKIAQRLSRPFNHIELVPQTLGIEPTLQLNDTTYFTLEDEVKIEDFMRNREIEQIQKRPRPEGA
jgi:hypothetical protein